MRKKSLACGISFGNIYQQMSLHGNELKKSNFLQSCRRYCVEYNKNYVNEKYYLYLLRLFDKRYFNCCKQNASLLM